MSVLSAVDQGDSCNDCVLFKTIALSWQGKEPEIVESLANYVADEYEDKLKEKVDTKGWTRR